MSTRRPSRDLLGYTPGAGGALRGPASDDDDSDAIHEIYWIYDKLLRAGEFTMVDDAFSDDLSAMPVVHSLALLSITSPASHLLPRRAAFAQSVRDRLATEDPSRVDDLLKGLE